MKKLKNPLALLLVVGVVVGAAIGYPLGNHTVTKIQTKTLVKDVTVPLATGESGSVAASALGNNGIAVHDQTINGQTFHCVLYYGHLNARKNPSDWFNTFCYI